MTEGYDPYWENHEEELHQMYEDYIWELVRQEGGTMEAMREREPFEEWRADL